jgi:DNA-binding transcriptional MerR regulator
MSEYRASPGLPERPAPWNREGGGPISSSGQDTYSIGTLAREFNVTLRALRFYESKGLLKPRREGSLRLYSASDRENLAQILKGKQLGFTLTEIRGLIASEDTETSAAPRLKLSREQCVEQIKLLERQRKDIEDAIAELRRTYTDLYTRTDSDPE